MITSKFGETKMHGVGLELRADFACITKAFKETFGEKEAREAFELGLLSKEERHARLGDKLRSELPDLLKDLVKEILCPDEGGKDEAE